MRGFQADSPRGDGWDHLPAPVPLTNRDGHSVPAQPNTARPPGRQQCLPTKGPGQPADEAGAEAGKAEVPAGAPALQEAEGLGEGGRQKVRGAFRSLHLLTAQSSA